MGKRRPKANPPEPPKTLTEGEILDVLFPPFSTLAIVVLVLEELDQGKPMSAMLDAHGTTALEWARKFRRLPPDIVDGRLAHDARLSAKSTTLITPSLAEIGEIIRNCGTPAAATCADKSPTTEGSKSTR